LSRAAWLPIAVCARLGQTRAAHRRDLRIQSGELARAQCAAVDLPGHILWRSPKKAISWGILYDARRLAGKFVTSSAVNVLPGRRRVR
jgi:hypothetical protein